MILGKYKLLNPSDNIIEQSGSCDVTARTNSVVDAVTGTQKDNIAQTAGIQKANCARVS